MKTRLILAAAALATVAAPALAQDWHRDGDHRGGFDHRDGDRGGDWRRDREWHGDHDRGWDRDRGGWDHDWRWRGRPFYGPRYVYPGGFGYRRWGIGAFLPAPLFAPGYYFNDFYRFGLAPPPYGLRWVRYGPDLLLVNVRNGHVVDVRYGLFG